MSLRIVITGGGTGGHLFPGIALATGMRERLDGCRVLFIGTPRQLDKQALAGYDFEQETIQCMGLKGMGWGHRLRSIMQLPAATAEAGRILKKFAPHLVFGVGGYVTGPVLLAARLRSIPVCIHEQNSVPGLANRMLSLIADRIFLSLPCRHRFPRDRTMLVGNPVRKEILAAAAPPRQAGAEKIIFILGGSQGAHRVNMLMIEAAEKLVRECPGRFRFIHQTGRADADAVRAGYHAMGAEAEVSDFFRDMAQLYARADLAVSRAGATTLAELSVMGVPALLIPYPYAADDHQRTNALHYEAGGGAIMLPEQELSGDRLAGEIVKLAENPGILQGMSVNMKKMARPDAAELIIGTCLELVAAKQGRSQAP
ncbi:MAG TPA: undecaprenyldiphospho-muramoylpentapeptide beta-N-acetylglucosaminyltransferase [Desulfobacteraceae bacterium]|nr:undecaprenyldiphospho-muramoylpentapeptide beta-N-acetylglucosaminyltransferase [Desulfobacteraceae bacterium]